MCLIVLSYKQDPRHPLVLIANRDEFYDRPSAPAGYWADEPEIFAGRDLRGGGTWLGVTKGVRFAAVTNFRDPAAAKGMRSRGELVVDWLRGGLSADEYLDQVDARSGEYSGFNLLIGQVISGDAEVLYYSNLSGKRKTLQPGTYGVSNHFLDTPWPKLLRARKRFQELLTNGMLTTEACFELLADRELADDGELPSTGISYEAEKALSAIFIETPGYGTRCSTFVRMQESGEWEFEERVFI